ncbi:hypothetical protein [Microbaculum marinum]|uniref:Integral membrane protein n=1 Tax=Microbaculum marinum TaxID=1764581 RepID=A0AAW9RUW5_9HYPH
MPTSLTSLPLRAILGIDAATCAVMGLVLITGAGFIAGVTAIPAGLLCYAGLALLPIAAFMAIVASRPTPPAAGVWLVVTGNVLWVAASLVLAFGGLIAPNGLGWAFVLAQALIVAALAWLEYGALRGAVVRLQAG